MDRLRGLRQRRPALSGAGRSGFFLLALGAILLLVYRRAASLRGVFYVGDIFRLNYPARALYAAGLGKGHIPLWTSDALGGYPILAEGQTGAYYPPNLLLYRWLALPAALNYSVLLTYWIMGAGVFFYTRSLGLRRGPAFLAACTFMLGGFASAHLNHLNMLAAVAWLPFLLWAVERATRAGRWTNWALVAAFFGLQGLAGHPQISLLSALLALGQALMGPLSTPGSELTPWRRVSQAAFCGCALLGGAALAAVQWGPTYELMRQSQREQGLDYQFFTSFSLAPADLIRLVSPFVHGNPFPELSQESIGYVGALPLVLAALAPLRCRNRVVAFWGPVALLAVLLALGRWNPAYRLLLHVPLLNRFRVPARYLLWLDLAVAVLAATGADSLLTLTREALPRPRLWAPGLGLPVVLGVIGISRLPLDSLLWNWRWLPFLWLAAAMALLIALRWRPPARLWSSLAIGLVLIDLGAFAGVMNRTYNDTLSPAEFASRPDVLRSLQADGAPALYRIYSPENWPDLPTMREALFPNIQLLYGVQSLSGYYPLVPAGSDWVLSNLRPWLLDLWNVRYVFVPQKWPTAGPTSFFLTEDPYARPLTGRSFDLAGATVASLEAEGFLIPSGGLPAGTPVGEIILEGAGGEKAVWTLRAGQDLASWAGPGEGQPAPPAVRVWTARFGRPPQERTGHTYLAQWSPGRPLAVKRIEVRALNPSAALWLERLRLIDPAGQARLLSDLVGEGDHVLAYCSSGVAVYRNTRAGPRAFLVHRAWVAPSEAEARGRLLVPTFKPREEVILSAGEPLAGQAAAGEGVQIEAYEDEYVRLRAVAASQAYLVLADSFYPGWVARLDGRPVEIQRADVALRAVALPPGEHVVEFRFEPLSWRWGGWVSAVSWLGVAAIVLKGRL